jgi:hypothetical protein
MSRSILDSCPQSWRFTMKFGVYLGVTVLVLAPITMGCQSRRFASAGKDARGHEYAVPANSIDGYAKAHGISRAEAAKRMRAEFVATSDAQAAKTPVETTEATPEKMIR